MRYKNMFIKTLSLFLILLLLAGYQTVLYVRSQQEEIAGLKTQINQLEGERDELFAAIREIAVDSEPGESAEETVESYRDGTYAGSGTGFGGPVKVEVKVEKGKIISVDITEAQGEDEAYLAIASQLLDDIVEAQGTDVDVISGASYSSQGIIDAVKDALEQAG